MNFRGPRANGTLVNRSNHGSLPYFAAFTGVPLARGPEAFVNSNVRSLAPKVAPNA